MKTVINLKCQYISEKNNTLVPSRTLKHTNVRKMVANATVQKCTVLKPVLKHSFVKAKLLSTLCT